MNKLASLALVLCLGCASTRCVQQKPQMRPPTVYDVACALGCVSNGGEMVSQENGICTCKFKLVPLLKPSAPDAGAEQQPTIRL